MNMRYAMTLSLLVEGLQAKASVVVPNVTARSSKVEVRPVATVVMLIKLTTKK